MADPAAFDFSSIIGAGATSGGGVAIVFWLVLKSKFDSLAALWKTTDQIKDDAVDAEKDLTAQLTVQKEDLLSKFTDQRVADAEKYATRIEMARIVDKLEQHLDKRMDTLEGKLDVILRKP